MEDINNNSIEIIDEFEILERIGGGGFSNVHIAKHLPTGCYVAAKIIDLNRLKQHEFIGIMREISVFMQVEHPYICTSYRLSLVEKRLIFFIEFANNGTLLNYVNKNGGLSEIECHRIFIQIFEVLRYLHVQYFLVHRDLKLENILLDSSNNIKLTDFGLSSTFYCNNMRSFVGTPGYTPPEILLGNDYDEKCDVWSLGICLYSMLTGNLPFGIQNSNYRKLIEEVENFKYPQEFSSLLLDLFHRMLDIRPSSRSSLIELQSHPWIKGISPISMNIAPTPIVFYKVSSISDILKFKRKSLKPLAFLIEKCIERGIDIEKLSKDLFEGLTTFDTTIYFILSNPLFEKPLIPEQNTSKIITSSKQNSKNSKNKSKDNSGVYKKAAALVLNTIPQTKLRRGSVRSPN